MIGAEWKKLLRQRWLIGIAILLIFVDVGLFLNTQYTEKKDRVAAVPLFAEYQKETADMTNEQAQEYLTDQLNTLSNFQFVQIALNGKWTKGFFKDWWRRIQISWRNTNRLDMRKIHWHL